jgi:hypothetical protein
VFKHAENTTAVNLKTLDFSRHSEFLVATSVIYRDIEDILGPPR